MDKFDNCLARILNVIKILQDNASRIDCNDNSCTKPFLGVNNTLLCFNTRPIMLYLCNNEPVTLNYTNSEGTEETTNVFRVENVTNDSVSVLLLEGTTDTSGNTTYTSTNTYATINLKCICAIRCLPDVIITNL